MRTGVLPLHGLQVSLSTVMVDKRGSIDVGEALAEERFAGGVPCGRVQNAVYTAVEMYFQREHRTLQGDGKQGSG